MLGDKKEGDGIKKEYEKTDCIFNCDFLADSNGVSDEFGRTDEKYHNFGVVKKD